MGDRAPLGEFLRNRRGRIGPAEVGLPAGTGRRQLPGLRRAELAALAGVSVDYYVRLEQGRDTNPGSGVLDALAGALRLDDDERVHLHRLAQRPRPRVATAPPTGVQHGLRQLVQAIRPAPAYLLDATGTIVAANPEGDRLMVGLAGWPAARRNIIRYVFAHPAAREVFGNWAEIAEDCVADLRTVAAADPRSPDLAALVSELSATSAEFAALWRRYDVRVNRGGRRRFRHPVAGAFELTSEVLAAADGRRLLIFHAPPGSPGHHAVRLLG